jgi:hypothetical protein
MTVAEVGLAWLVVAAAIVVEDWLAVRRAWAPR